MTASNHHRHTIIRTGTLVAFLLEVPAGATVRLIQTHQQNDAFRTLFLHVQALTATGAVTWLCEAHQIMCWQEGEPAGPKDKQIADGMASLQAQLRDYLLANDYLVRDETEFGLPDNIKPLRGRIGRWGHGPDGALRVKLDLPRALPEPTA